jgi:malic enzyme
MFWQSQPFSHYNVLLRPAAIHFSTPIPATPPVGSLHLLGMVKRGGLTPEAAASHFWLLDAQGLVTQYRPGLPSYVSDFARPTSCSVADEGDGLLEVVRKVKPTVLLGLAGEAAESEDIYRC